MPSIASFITHFLTPREKGRHRWVIIGSVVAAAHAAGVYGVWFGTSEGVDAVPPPFAEAVIPVTAVTLAPVVRTPPRATRATAPQPAASVHTSAPALPETEPQNPISPPPDTAEPEALLSTEPVTLALAPPPLIGAPQAAAASPSSGTQPFVLPPPVQWRYEVLGRSKGLSYRASALLDWKPGEQHYQARMAISAFFIGSRTQNSSGSIGPQGLAPQEFVDAARKERRITFDYSTQLIRQTDNDASAPLPSGVQDRLSLFIQLAGLLAALPQPPHAGDTWSLPVAGSPQAESWHFNYIETETLHLPAGTFNTWKISRSPRHEGDQHIEMWLAPSQHHLPVRIRLRHSNGDEVDQQLATGSLP